MNEKDFFENMDERDFSSFVPSPSKINMVHTPTLYDKYCLQFFNELQEHLEIRFPKKKCEERGAALVLNAYANLLFQRLLLEYMQEIIKKRLLK